MNTQHSSRWRAGARGWIVGVVMAGAVACSTPPADEPTAGPGDAELQEIGREAMEAVFTFQPTLATALGVHRFDNLLSEYSSDVVEEEATLLHELVESLDELDVSTLSPASALDHEMLRRALQSRLVELEDVRSWERNPDYYSSGITNTAYVMISRKFAQPRERMRLLVERLKAMPRVLDEARENLNNPPRVFTEIAIEQLDGNREFFTSAVAQAFPEVKDAGLRAQFNRSIATVSQALADYKVWLEEDLLPRSNGDFALGEALFLKKLAADEMVELPLTELLTLADVDLKRNQAAFAATARLIDRRKPARQVQRELEEDHPSPAHLLSETQATLDALKTFLTEHQIVTIPEAAPAIVQETPPFLRATSSASMDIPGPFEKVAVEAYYSMTLPDESLSAEEKDAFMRQWYRAAISNVSVHEAYPGHYLQFLYAKEFPSDVRKVFGANSNAEGWAHYAEQMVIDEGFHADDPRYRLAQIQDALLRDVRFIAGIKMHTQGMTLEQAQTLFEEEGYQIPEVARSEARRGAGDPTYGYYTLGKLMILKLREDYEAKMGDEYSLKRFHDEFIQLGPLPLPLVRIAMLGERGDRLFR